MTVDIEARVQQQSAFIAGGTMSLNRAATPRIQFVSAQGAYLTAADGRRFIDYHAGFAPYLFGHADKEIDEAVIEAIRSNQSLIGIGTMPWEAEVAELIAGCVPSIDQLQLTTTGSEAVGYGLRLARAYTGRSTVVVMQGGYNGVSDYVAFNLMEQSDEVRGHEPGTLYAPRVISAGVPQCIEDVVRVIEYNDLAAAEKALATRDVAALIVEPVLHNIGVVKPRAGYLEGLRRLCDQYGTVLIFDEVKTGFRHALGGYQQIAGVMPDLCTFGKAVANGYPMGVIGGRKEIMSLCADPDPKRRVTVAGTYNGHPVNVAAALASLKRLKSRESEVYGELERLGQRMEDGLKTLFAAESYPATVVRQGSTFTVYFMDHEPANWQDIVLHNDMARDLAYRRALIDELVYHFPVVTKQGSISLAHTDEEIDVTLERTEKALRKIRTA